MAENDGFVLDRERGLYLPRGMESAGKAYGLFNCEDGREAVEAVIGDIPYVDRTIPREIQLYLHKGTGSLDDEGLQDFLRKNKADGFDYAVEATYRGGTSEDAARELRQVMNHIYSSPLFSGEGGMEAAIAYKGEHGFGFMD